MIYMYRMSHVMHYLCVFQVVQVVVRVLHDEFFHAEGCLRVVALTQVQIAQLVPCLHIRLVAITIVLHLYTSKDNIMKQSG